MAFQKRISNPKELERTSFHNRQFFESDDESAYKMKKKPERLTPINKEEPNDESPYAEELVKRFKKYVP